MKRIVLFSVIVICLVLLGLGILQKKPDLPQHVNEVINQVVTPPKAELATDTAPVTGAVTKEVKRYYPDTGATVGSEGVATGDPSRDFQVTPSLLAKMYLAEKYDPGICFGAPSSPPSIAVANLISDQKPLAEFLRGQYDLTSDLEVFNKIKQFQDITLTETASSQYNFKFMDGQCQNVTYYEGTVKVSGTQVTDTVTTHDSHTYK